MKKENSAHPLKKEKLTPSKQINKQTINNTKWAQKKQNRQT